MSDSNSGGIGFVGLLTIAFVVLKLTHVIDWSWWLVFAPVLISATLGLLAIGIFFLVMWIEDRK